MIREANLHWRYEDTESGLIMPWYTLPCLQWLKSIDIKSWSVFEYGCGYSTIWYRLNAKIVQSVDHNISWAEAMGAMHENDKLTYIKRSMISNPDWDLVVVDGEYRDECVEKSKIFVKPGGYIIVDNYDQEDFPPGEVIDEILKGWEKQVFNQPNHGSWKTAVFKKP